MKAFTILPAIAAVIMALNISTASSQGACQQEFTACMNECTGRSSKGMQDTCFNSCEGKNNLCAERIYGKRPFNGSPSTAAAQKAQAKDTLAKTDSKTEKEPAVEPEQAPAPAPAPQKRAPAKR